MQLGKDLAELVRDRQSKVGGVFQQAQAFIAQVEADDGPPQDGPAADYMCVDDVGHTDQHQDQHLFADAFEANGAGQLLER